MTCKLCDGNGTIRVCYGWDAHDRVFWVLVDGYDVACPCAWGRE